MILPVCFRVVCFLGVGDDATEMQHFKNAKPDVTPKTSITCCCLVSQQCRGLLVISGVRV